MFYEVGVTIFVSLCGIPIHSVPAGAFLDRVDKVTRSAFRLEA
jgi:hypothetical protein